MSKHKKASGGSMPLLATFVLFTIFLLYAVSSRHPTTPSPSPRAPQTVEEPRGQPPQRLKRLDALAADPPVPRPFSPIDIMRHLREFMAYVHRDVPEIRQIYRAWIRHGFPTQIRNGNQLFTLPDYPPPRKDPVALAIFYRAQDWKQFGSAASYNPREPNNQKLDTIGFGYSMPWNAWAISDVLLHEVTHWYDLRVLGRKTAFAEPGSHEEILGEIRAHELNTLAIDAFTHGAFFRAVDRVLASPNELREFHGMKLPKPGAATMSIEYALPDRPLSSDEEKFHNVLVKLAVLFRQCEDDSACKVIAYRRFVDEP